MEEKGLNWISVKDRLPELYKSVLAVIDYGQSKRVDITFLCDSASGDKRWFFRDNTLQITHWMPIPETPKEERTYTKEEPIKWQNECKYKNGDVVYFIDYYANGICAGIVSETKAVVDPWDCWVHMVRVNNDKFHHHLDIYGSFEDAYRALSICRRPRAVSND